MFGKASLVIATGLFLAANVLGQDAATAEKKKLDGTWTLVAAKIDGQSVVLDNLKDARLLIDGDHYSFRIETARLEFHHRVDPAQTPKAIDLVIADGKDEGKIYKGIYELNGDRLKICRNVNPDQARPTRFVSEPGSGLMLVEWRRAAP